MDEQGPWGGGNLIQEGKDFQGEEVRVALGVWPADLDGSQGMGKSSRFRRRCWAQ